jgi:hypothetical protein
VQTDELEHVRQPAMSALHPWQTFEERTKLSLRHAVQTVALEQTAQPAMRELQAVHAPPCKAKPELQVRQRVELEHVVQLAMSELQG